MTPTRIPGGLSWNLGALGPFDSQTCAFSIADNLPVATRLEFYSNRDEEEKKKEKDVQFEHGYRLGFMDGNKVKGLKQPGQSLGERHGEHHSYPWQKMRPVVMLGGQQGWGILLRSCVRGGHGLDLQTGRMENESVAGGVP